MGSGQVDGDLLYRSRFFDLVDSSFGIVGEDDIQIA
jgi:hypothetical protein